ncbi:hypothetical protein QM427_11695 [Tatlockia sp. PL877]|nr:MULTISPECIES: DUF6671 family protein [unclassified Legionella]MDI9819812.1 hypothetical protein [Legionella sp. PL877]
MGYKNQPVLLASKHKKEQAISGVFFNKLGCNIHVEAFDTDQFGTFTGEIPRPLPSYETCILKAKKAGDAFGYQYSIASEGSFGPYPGLPFVAADHEIMVFLDRKNNWLIAEQLTTMKTNYNTLVINEETDITGFLEQVKFPSHELTLQKNLSRKVIAKGINERNLLNASLK